MLDVRDMSEEDKLFNFLSGLQAWAQRELRRQSVKDLPSVIATANRLVDYRVTSGSEPEKKKKDFGKDKGKSGKTKKSCYLYKGDHRMRDCPKRGKLNALVAEADDDDEGRPSRVNTLQLLGAMQGCLLYVQVQVNGKVVMSMLHTGATHNFLADREIQNLGLTLTQHSSRIKAVNSKVKSIQGVACVDLKMGSWTGNCNMMVVPLDDFDVILRMDFMLLAHAMIIPYLSGLFIANANCTSFVQGTYLQDSVRSAEKKDTLLSALQEVPDEVVEVLEEFNDVFSPKLPKRVGRVVEAVGCAVGGTIWFRVLFQRKQDSMLRMCMDYRALNKVTIKNKYPIPNVMDCFDKLTKAKYYTKIDLGSGYWQVRVARGDEPKTTCVTQYSSFKFLVMPFGLTNAPTTFCNLMNNVLYEFLDRFVVVYLDDIVVYSESLTSLEAFKKLREYELYVKKEKCEFYCEQITFLGHVISEGKIQMDSQKVQLVVDWGIPSKSTWGCVGARQHPVAFESRKLKDGELRYSIHEKEMIVVARWQEFLGEFNFDWVHRPDKHNDVADALSQKLVEEFVAALTVVESDLFA
ncbi:UNVERIFIED_CONTAM: RNA-directed DNA polymerase [Sesamum calycinum]|uniref:RNA-directed DNA polymerase n=1 Tax=Sesamum calycinum TaxID=2727403 RepID=A0AAW2PBV8_9LAMI